ncbi:hypothetical protein SteCoe_9612 [Stentor coeruleus]|uniref:Condensin complex subunit 1 C-terminal domain-containing protein n=1 Tax=Stentor coeruleus TaxID=5963 RepID=A0A1R2CHH7_9CILI|nr:hypothetical protein SteCoe_9612 [Stentor coeruleus]
MEHTLDTICLAFDNPDIIQRSKSIEIISDIDLNEQEIAEIIIPRLVKYLDDSEELLLIIIIQLIKLKDRIYSKGYALSLFLPLKILASIIDDVVRLAAVNAIAQLLMFYSLTESYLSDLIGHLVKSVNKFSIYSAIDLIEIFFNDLSMNFQLQYINLLVDLFTSGNIDRRIRICSAVQNLIRKVSRNQGFEVFFGLFADDPEDLVRIYAVDLAGVMRLDVTDKENLLRDQSWKVRYYIAKSLSVLMNENNTQKICQTLLEYLNDQEAEVKTMAFLCLEEVFARQNENQSAQYVNILNVVRDVVLQLPNLNISIVNSILRLCPLVGKENCQEYLLSIVKNLLTEPSNYDYEVALIQNIDCVLLVTSIEFIESNVLPVIIKLLEHKMWKIRIKALSLLPKLGKDLGCDFFMQFLYKFLLKSLNDLVHAVRTEAMHSISKITDFFPSKWMQVHIFPEVLEKSKCDCYINRITSLNLLIELYTKLDFEVFGDEVVNIIQRLTDDKVVNVRICVAKLCICILNWPIPIKYIEFLKGSQEKLKKDEDIDVKCLASEDL